MRHIVQVEEMCGSQCLEVSRIVAGGGDWASIDDHFDLCDQSDEGIDLGWVFGALGSKMAFEKLDDTFPDAALMWGARRDEGPRDANALQFRRRRQVPREELLDGGIGAQKIVVVRCPLSVV